MMLVMWRGWDFTRRALADTIRRRADPEPHLARVRNAFSLVPAASGGATS